MQFWGRLSAEDKERQVGVGLLSSSAVVTNVVLVAVTAAVADLDRWKIVVMVPMVTWWW